MRRERRTGVERGRDGVEHVSVHVRVYSPVGVSVVAGSHEHGVTLSDSDGDEVDGRLLDVSL